MKDRLHEIQQTLAALQRQRDRLKEYVSQARTQLQRASEMLDQEVRSHADASVKSPSGSRDTLDTHRAD